LSYASPRVYLKVTKAGTAYTFYYKAAAGDAWTNAGTYSQAGAVPVHFQQMAGLVCYYDNMNFVYLRVYYSESLQSKCLGILSSDNGQRSEHLPARVPIGGWTRIYLRAAVSLRKLQFYFSPDGETWRAIGPMLDASKLSDKYSQFGEFTGSFVDICAQDLYRRELTADFDYFEYRELQ